LSEVFDTFLEELEARTAIEDCLKRFARAVDRQDWKAAREGYHDGAFDDHGFFKGPPDPFLAHVAKLHETQHHSMHFNTNVLVLQRFADRRVTASARYLDRFEKRSGEWKVVHRTLVFGDIVPEPLKEPVRFPEGFTEQKHGMDDPLYSLRKR
jgi:ketosteroid isomerase-like protein